MFFSNLIDNLTIGIVKKRPEVLERAVDELTKQGWEPKRILLAYTGAYGPEVGELVADILVKRMVAAWGVSEPGGQ